MMMFTILSICAVFFSILLILIVLVQKPKQDGGSAQFGSAGVSQLVGITRTVDLMERLTWGLAAIILLLTLSASFFLRKGQITISPNINKAQQEATLPEMEETEEESGSEETKNEQPADKQNGATEKE